MTPGPLDVRGKTNFKSSARVVQCFVTVFIVQCHLILVHETAESSINS